MARSWRILSFGPVSARPVEANNEPTSQHSPPRRPLMNASNRNKRALVVIDVQNDYFADGLPIEYPPVARTLPNIGRAMDAARAAGVPVVVVQNTAPAGSPVFDKGTPG